MEERMSEIEIAAQTVREAAARYEAAERMVWGLGMMNQRHDPDERRQAAERYALAQAEASRALYALTIAKAAYAIIPYSLQPTPPQPIDGGEVE
jgi:hypothetical protein